MSKKPFNLVLALSALVVAVFVALIVLYFIQDKNRRLDLAGAKAELRLLTEQVQSLRQLDFSNSQEKQSLSRSEAKKQLTDLGQALHHLATASAHLHDPELAPQIETLIAGLPALEDQLSGLQHLDPHHTPFYHLRLAVPDFQPSSFSIVNGGEQAFFADQNHHRGLLLNLNSKRFEPYALLNTPFPPTTSQTTFYQLSGNALYSAKFAAPEQIFARPLLPTDFATQVKHFLSSSTHAYFFTSETIYKVANPTLTSSDYPTEPTLWLNPGQVLPASNLISDLKLSDYLWLTTTDGYLYRLAGGKIKQLEFPDEPRLAPENLASIEHPLLLELNSQHPEQIFLLAPTIGHLYVLDIDKLEIIADYTGEQLLYAIDLAYNSLDNSLLILNAQGAIYQINL